MPAAPAVTSPRRRRWWLLVAAAAVGLWSTGVGSAVVDRVTGQQEPPARPFTLQGDHGAPAAPPDEPPPLDHPVPADLEASPSTDAVPAALADDDWFTTGFAAAEIWSLQRNSVWRPVNPYAMNDFQSPGLSVQNGLRSTWRPPPCRCPTVKVWMYGGSTTYGLHQRDDHTIASEIARLAADDGIRLDIDNRGMPGSVQWLEGHRFALDLATDPHPEVVIFYDGVNETVEANALNNGPLLDSSTPIDPILDDIWNGTERSSPPIPDAPPGARLIGRPTGPGYDLAELAKVAVGRYDRARARSKLLAKGSDIRPIYFWQPSRVSRELVLAEPHGNADNEQYIRLRDQLQAAALPGDVVNLVDVLDDNTDPLFTDDVHHNEAGARIIARAIYASMSEDLNEIIGERDRN